jgi:hypothetical protein
MCFENRYVASCGILGERLFRKVSQRKHEVAQRLFAKPVPKLYIAVLINKRAHIILWLLIPVVLILSMVANMDLDGGIVMGATFTTEVGFWAILTSLLFAISGFVYLRVRNRKLLNVLTWLHLIITVLACSALLVFEIQQNKPLRRFYSSSGTYSEPSFTESLDNMETIGPALWILGLLLFLANVIYALTKSKAHS